ncbi:MAG: hypothetical protein HYV61_04875 [Candidatus Rokubacteria bacterium]|nr:hypothetical protein [Candidatus Rokubacteria bacterium]
MSRQWSVFRTVAPFFGSWGFLLLFLPSSVTAIEPLRIAITPVLVEHYLDVNRQWIAYVGEKLGRETHPVSAGGGA